jgi:hypothetical protein
MVMVVVVVMVVSVVVVVVVVGPVRASSPQHASLAGHTDTSTPQALQGKQILFEMFFYLLSFHFYVSSFFQLPCPRVYLSHSHIPHLPQISKSHAPSPIRQREEVLFVEGQTLY